MDEIRGIRGIKRENALNSYCYNFTLDRLLEDGIWLNLEFTIDPAPASKSPEAALAEATFIAQRLVFASRASCTIRGAGGA